MSMKILIKNGRVIDPATGLDAGDLGHREWPHRRPR